MNNKSISPFVRKIIYIACIGGLLIPLSMISRPEVRDSDGKIVDGGRIAKLRRDFELSQASISEIDPTSETMKLASLGLRGVAVNVLWMQALEHQKNEDWDKLAATLQTLTKIQPNFVKVWEYQGHNLAFNVSMEFDDYEYRYEWVKKGLSFLKGGIPYNKKDHRMTDLMGFFTGTKFGKSDEKMPFRRMFRKDDLFHTSMSDRIDPESYDTREYGPDTYRMAWQWYDISQDLVDVRSNDRYKTDLMMGMFRPAQTRNQASILAEEFRSDEVIQEIWSRAYDEWVEYGNREMSNASNIAFTLEKMDSYERRLSALRAELDELAPGIREREMKAKWISLGLEESAFATLDLSPEELNDEQRQVRAQFLQMMNSSDENFDGSIAMAAPPGNELEARRILESIQEVLRQMQAISSEGGIVNYSFWKSRNAAEASDEMIRARQAIFDAKEMKRKSIYADEFVVDYRSGEEKILRQGSETLFIEAFSRWKTVLEEYPDLVDSPLADLLLTDILEYYQLLLFAGKEWPNDFPLQDFVDQKEARGEGKGLPTSSTLEERDEMSSDDSVEDGGEEIEEGASDDGAGLETQEAKKSDDADESDDPEDVDSESDDSEKDET